MSKQTNSSNNNPDGLDPSAIPNLDQIINQITSNGDFKEMMNNVSEGLQMPIKETPVTVTEPTDETVEPSSKSSESLYDLCCTFLSDGDGNSLADILTQVNQNLQKISDNLEKIANKPSL